MEGKPHLNPDAGPLSYVSSNHLATNGAGMGLSTTAVLVAANIVISALRNIIPARVRLPGEIVVVASLVTIVDMLMEGFTPSLYSALGIYIP